MLQYALLYLTGYEDLTLDPSNSANGVKTLVTQKTL